ncbi:FtsX-like permease family protein [Luteimonas sp. MJ246]|uniref:FtsX-like permease family protein n=1 Tax=Luteimonas sp. MJ174 TaxID=3129237 RepID=UPI0031BA60EB
MPAAGGMRHCRACAALTWLRLRESLGRHAYLVATLVVGVAGFWILGALASPFVARTALADASITVSSAREGGLVPVRYAAEVSRMPAVENVNHMNVLAVVCKPPAGIATLNGWGGDDPERRLRSIRASQEDIDAWLDSPHAVLAGAELAERCGWSRGMTIEPAGLRGQAVPVTIAGIFHSDEGGFGEQIAIAHYAHVDRLLPDAERDQARIIQVSGQDPLALAELAADIEALLQHGDPPVQAHVADGGDSVLGSFGNVSALLRAVVASLGLCVLLVFTSIAAHLAAQRRSSMAMLQALGFDRNLQLAAIVFELSAVAATGAALGTLLGLSLLEAISARTSHVLGRLDAPLQDTPWLVACLLALVALASLAPAFTVRRLRPVDLVRG